LFKINQSFTLDQYDFPHLVKYFTKEQFVFKNIKYHLTHLLQKLQIDNTNKEKGAIIILQPTYLFVCPLTKPYNFYEGIPLYAEPEFFAGIFCLPRLETIWPQTIKDKYIENNFIDILKISTS